MEALLLKSAPSLEPPPSAEGELWKRLEVLGTVGAAALASGVAVHAAASAGPKIAGKVAANAIWLSLIKWGIVVSVGVVGAGAATRYVVHRKTAVNDVVTARATTSHVNEAAAKPADTSAITSAPIDTSAKAASIESTAPAGMPSSHGHTRAPGESSAEARSALRAESLLLGAARAKLGSGDAQGALDDVARLRAQFPRGKLVQEREVVAMDSLAILGNRSTLQARARAFLARFPSSPYADHVRSIAAP